MKNLFNFDGYVFEQIKFININESGTPYFMGDQGLYSDEFKKFYDDMVPNSGSAKYVNGELIRIVSRILHEYYNNGNGNAAQIQMEEECYDNEVWDDDAEEYYTDTECEEVEGACTISRFYMSMLEFAVEHGPADIIKTVEKIEDIICNTDNDYNEINNKYYTEFADKIIKYVIDNESSAIEVQNVEPEYYKMHN
jgi:hypothetical protein